MYDIDWIIFPASSVILTAEPSLVVRFAYCSAMSCTGGACSEERAQMHPGMVGMKIRNLFKRFRDIIRSLGNPLAIGKIVISRLNQFLIVRIRYVVFLFIIFKEIIGFKSFLYGNIVFNNNFFFDFPDSLSHIIVIIRGNIFSREACASSWEIPGTGKTIIKEAVKQGAGKRTSVVSEARTLHTYTNTLKILCAAMGIDYAGTHFKCERD